MFGMVLSCSRMILLCNDMTTSSGQFYGPLTLENQVPQSSPKVYTIYQSVYPHNIISFVDEC